MPQTIVKEQLCIIPNEKLSNYEIIGEGGFGCVYKARHEDWGIVAVKSLKAEHVSDRHKKNLEAEAANLAKLNHQNVVQLYGVVLSAGNYSVVLEYVEYGNMDDFIQDYEVPWNLKIQLVYSIILGMNYLHTQEPPMIHRDLKTQNLLVTNGFECKLTDFGLSRWKSYSRQHTSHGKNKSQAGTITHIPPEVWSDCNCKPDTKCDVYAMGIVLFEVLTESCPFEGLLDRQITQSVLSGQRPDTTLIPTDAPSKLVILTELCWKQEAKDRPTFADLKQTLDEQIHNHQFKDSCEEAKVELLRQINGETRSGRNLYADELSIKTENMHMNSSTESTGNDPRLPYPVQKQTPSLESAKNTGCIASSPKKTIVNNISSKRTVAANDLQVDAAPFEPGKASSTKKSSAEFDAKSYLKKGSPKHSSKPKMNYYGPIPPPGLGKHFMANYNVQQKPAIIHSSGSGSTTMIYNTSGMDAVQIGDNNVMYVNSSGSVVPHRQYTSNAHKQPKSGKVRKSENPIDSDNMRIIARHVGQPWAMLGRQLGLSDGELEALENDYRGHGHEEIVYQMLNRWVQKVGKRKCQLGIVAKELDTIGKADVADRLVDK